MFRNTATPPHSSKPSFYRVLMLLLLSALSLIMTQCGGPPSEIPCGDFEHPAQRKTYSGWPNSSLVLDDNGSSFLLFLGPEFGYAGEAHQYAGEIDKFFRQLAKDGYGSWNGCYLKAKNPPIMVSYVSVPSETMCHDKTGCNPARNDEDEGVLYWDVNSGGIPITRFMVAHEWTHSVVNHTTQLWAQGGQKGQRYSGQSGALYEALADIFAFLSTSDKRENNISIQKSEVYVMSDYSLPSKCKNPQDANECKYTNMGIPKQATNLMINGGLSSEEVARIYFHALNPIYIEPEADFRSFALGVQKACLDIASKSELATQDVNGKSFTILASDCEQVRKAFQEVGMIPEPLVINAPPTEKLNGWDSFWKGIGQSITDVWEKVKDWPAQQWEALKKLIETQVNQCMQEAAKTVQSLVQSLCGVAMLPGGVVVVLGAMRRHRRRYIKE